MHPIKETLRVSAHILTLAILVTIFSCGRIKRQGHDAVDKTKEVVSGTKQKISKKAAELIDQQLPKPSIDTHGTARDKKRFREYLLADLPEDVKDINSYVDFFGADYKVLIAFTSDQSTIDRIVAHKKMALNPKKDDNGLFFGEAFSWWNKDTLILPGITTQQVLQFIYQVLLTKEK